MSEDRIVEMLSKLCPELDHTIPYVVGHHFAKLQRGQIAF